MNKTILLGRLVRDPELSTTSNGTAICKFTLAVPRKYTNQDGEKETDFLNCSCWRQLAENVNKFIRKGSQVLVVGSIQNRTYEAQDGTKKYITEILADEVEFVSSPKSDGSAKEETSANKQQALTPIDDDGSNPFPF